METKKLSPPSSSKIKKPFFVFLLFLASLTTIFFLDLKTRVKTIAIRNEGNHKMTGLDDYKNISLFLIDDSEIAGDLKKKNPDIKSVRIKKKFPSSLLIYPDFYRPSAILTVSTGYFILSEDGRILAKTKENLNDLPVVNYYQKLNYYSYSSGDYLDLKDIGLGILFSERLARLGFKVDILDIADRDMLVCNVGEKKIIFTAVKDTELQLYELNQIIRQFKIKGQDFKAIDLRFEKPVIKL